MCYEGDMSGEQRKRKVNTEWILNESTETQEKEVIK